MGWFFGWCAGFAQYPVNAEVDEYGCDYQAHQTKLFRVDHLLKKTVGLELSLLKFDFL
ncbi:MAG: hypothetical protein R3E36_05390 [Nitrosomonas sp.]|nr:hypothetical protein [Nitrosomonas sp.]